MASFNTNFDWGAFNRSTRNIKTPKGERRRPKMTAQQRANAKKYASGK